MWPNSTQGGSPEGGSVRTHVCECACVAVVSTGFQGGRGLCLTTPAGTQVGGYLKAYRGWTLSTPALRAWVGASMDNL